MKAARIAAVTLALGAGLSACGSSSSSSGLSRSKLIAQADAICSATQKAATAVKAPASFTDAQVAAAYFDQIGPITDKETSDLKALSPAGDVKTDWNAFIAKQVAANDLLQTIKQKADAKDPSGLQDLSKVQAAGTAVAGAATKLGAKTCAQ
jgi:hypothetical protein